MGYFSSIQVQEREKEKKHAFVSVTSYNFSVNVEHLPWKMRKKNFSLFIWIL